MCAGFMLAGEERGYAGRGTAGVGLYNVDMPGDEFEEYVTGDDARGVEAGG